MSQCWRKSSYSGTQGGNCIKVAGHDGMILARDTKDHGHGRIHKIHPGLWRAFVERALRESGLDDSGRLP